MKIKSLHIKNFRSLEKLDMEDVGDLVILVGANSSGKTNVIDALTLFFNELTPEIQHNIGSIPDYTWFDRDSTNSIIFDVTFELNKKDTSEIFSTDIEIDLPKEQNNHIRIIRAINGQANAAVWTTELLEINKKIVHGPISETPVPDQQKTEAGLAGKILTNLTKYTKSKFIFIPAARDSIASYAGFTARQTIINATLLSELRNIAQTSTRDARRKWQKLEGLLQKVSPHVADMRILDGDFNVREQDSNNTFPLHWVGGGYQELLMLLYQLIKSPDVIFGIDEPEIHLHPGLARGFLDILKDLATEQQLFITTHSPIFVDRSDLTNVWLVKKIGDSSQITRLQDIEDLNHITVELGIRPSDIFYSNVVVFVEGTSDMLVLPILARKMGVNFEAGEVSFISTHGKSQGKYHLKTFIESTNAANIPFFMILDKGAGKETKDFVKKNILKPDDNLFLLKEGDIEDYYSRSKLIDAVCLEYNIELTEAEKKKLEDGSAVKGIETMLEQKIKEIPKGWKTVIGRKVAEAMEEDEISEELKRIIERIARKASL